VRIPKGTIIYIQDPQETRLSPRQFNKLDYEQKSLVERYSYIDAQGHLVMSADHAKFMNHSCECNTIGTAYGFEIAIRNIAAGEELTAEYGVLNIQLEYEIGCDCANCRKILRITDIDQHYALWDQWITAVLPAIPRVPQPLWPRMDVATRNAVEACLSGRENYRSVLQRKWRVPAEKENDGIFEWTFQSLVNG
ncbi:MAG TPA: SET domain-containing protein-lysine N-methyltransferase, partial [Gammaproteobacteria bacterium]